MKKDNSTTDFDEIRIKNSKLITANTDNNSSQCDIEERKNDAQRSGSLQRYNSNGLLKE